MPRTRLRCPARTPVSAGVGTPAFLTANRLPRWYVSPLEFLLYARWGEACRLRRKSTRPRTWLGTTTRQTARGLSARPYRSRMSSVLLRCSGHRGKPSRSTTSMSPRLPRVPPKAFRMSPRSAPTCLLKRHRRRPARLNPHRSTRHRRPSPASLSLSMPPPTTTSKALSVSLPPFPSAPTSRSRMSRAWCSREKRSRNATAPPFRLLRGLELRGRRLSPLPQTMSRFLATRSRTIVGSSLVCWPLPGCLCSPQPFASPSAAGKTSPPARVRGSQPPRKTHQPQRPRTQRRRTQRRRTQRCPPRRWQLPQPPPRPQHQRRRRCRRQERRPSQRRQSRQRPDRRPIRLHRLTQSRRPTWRPLPPSHHLPRRLPSHHPHRRVPRVLPSRQQVAS